MEKKEKEKVKKSLVLDKEVYEAVFKSANPTETIAKLKAL